MEKTLLSINERGESVFRYVFTIAPVRVSTTFTPFEKVPTQRWSPIRHNPCTFVKALLGMKKEKVLVFGLKRFRPPSSVPIHKIP